MYRKECVAGSVSFLCCSSSLCFLYVVDRFFCRGQVGNRALSHGLILCQVNFVVLCVCYDPLCTVLANGVHWYGHVLWIVGGRVLRRVDDHVLRREDGCVSTSAMEYEGQRTKSWLKMTSKRQV